MESTFTIPDAQWQEFQQLAQEAVETKWNGSYEDFVTYIMMVNLENSIESQKRKQEKKMKRAKASYEESLKKEQIALTASPVVKPDPAPEPPVAKQPEDKPKTMTDKELSARIAQLQAIAVKKRTLAETTELNNLLRMHKEKAKK
jgi:hypothetical protein